MATTLGTLNPFRYIGYCFDEETGLYYLRIAKAVLSAVVADTSNVLIWDYGFTVADDLGLGLGC